MLLLHVQINCFSKAYMCSTKHVHSLLPKNAHASSFVLQTLLGYSNKYCISLFLTTCSSLKGEINLMAKSYIYKSFATGGKAILLGLRLRFSKTLQTFLLIYKSINRKILSTLSNKNTIVQTYYCVLFSRNFMVQLKQK